MDLKQLRKRIGFNFKRIRESRGPNQETTGAAGEATQGYISGIERGHKGFGIKAQLKWAEIFGVDFSYFFLPEDIEISDFEWIQKGLRPEEKELVEIFRGLSQDEKEELIVVLEGLVGQGHEKAKHRVENIRELLGKAG